MSKFDRIVNVYRLMAKKDSLLRALLETTDVDKFTDEQYAQADKAYADAHAAVRRARQDLLEEYPVEVLHSSGDFEKHRNVLGTLFPDMK